MKYKVTVLVEETWEVGSRYPDQALAMWWLGGKRTGHRIVKETLEEL